MKQILLTLMDKRVEVWCLNYIYSGTLTKVSDDAILLKDCTLVYETGPLNKKSYEHAESFGAERIIQIQHIESVGLAKC